MLALPRAKRARAADGEAPTAGLRWFDMPAPEVTAALRRDLTVLWHRAYLDPKRHFKTEREDRARAPGSATGRRPGSLPRFFQVGTVVESGGISSAPRAPGDAGAGAGGASGGANGGGGAPARARAEHPSLVAALLADEAFRAYARRNVEAVQRRGVQSRARAPRGGGAGRGGRGGRGRGGGGGGRGGGGGGGGGRKRR